MGGQRRRSPPSSRWTGYYARTADRPPRETLLRALARFDAEPPPPGGARRLAVDLGCGTGRDAIELLRRGWRVLAIDAEPEALRTLRARPDLPPGAALETHLARFEDAGWPGVDLVNASFALPFCPPLRFPGLWARIVRSLRKGGRFAGQLLGDRDDWSADPALTSFTQAEAEALLAGLDVEDLWEEETDTVTPRGRAKRWHLFHVVARRP